MLYDLENIGFSRPAPAYSPVESADFYSDNATQYMDTNATQYAGECYPEEDVTPVAEETDTYEYDENLYETNESNFEIEDGVLIKYNGNAEYVKIPYGVTKIGDNAFADCINLNSINIPHGVIEIEQYLFWKCENLTSIIIPNSVTKIKKFAFSGCNSLTSITIPTSVTEIGAYAFERCTNLTSVTIPYRFKSRRKNIS